MSQTLINTLHFADRLKEAGFARAQAEARARVLGDELTAQLPSKADFQTLQADFKTLEAKVEGLAIHPQHRTSAGRAARGARAG